jgi:hypothetical protein
MIGAGPRSGAADDARRAMTYDVRMLADLIAALALSFPIPAEEVGCPGYYYDPCDLIEFWSTLAPVNAAQIPSDGVLVLQGAYHGTWDDDALATVELAVTLAGEPVAGAIERSPAPGVLVWRPAAPLTPGAAYELSGSVSNMNPSGVTCADSTVPIAGDLVIAAEPGAPLGQPGLSGTPSVSIEPIVKLTTLACCAGEQPNYYVGSCDGPSLSFDPAVCAPIRGVGYLTVTLTGTPAAEGPAAQQILYTRRIIGAPAVMSLEPAFEWTAEEPFCAAIEALDLASGVITTSQSLCFGDMLVDELGPQDLAVPETLTCALRQCEVVETGWNLKNCDAVDPAADSSTAGGGEDGDKGCGCNSGGAGEGVGGPGGGGGAGQGAVLLGLLGVLGLGRRRRAR